MRHKFIFVVFILVGILNSLVLRGEARGSIAGTVSTGERQSWPGQVTVYRLAIVDGSIQARAECITLLESDGRFNCKNLPEGAYIALIGFDRAQALSATASKMSSLGNRPPLRAIAAVAAYPTFTLASNANLIHLRYAQTESIDLNVDESTLSTILAEPALGIATGQISIFAQGDGFALPLNLQPDITKKGDYIWTGMPAGTYKLVETWSDENGESCSSTRVLDLRDATVQRVSMRNGMSHRIQGTVTREDRKSIDPARLILESPDHRLDISVQKDGTFVIPDAEDGTYHVSFAASDHMSISEVKVGDKTIDNQSISLGEITAMEPLTITAKAAKGNILGSVSLDGSEDRPGVVAESLDSHTGIAVPTDSVGNFEIVGVPEGQYRIYAWADLRRVPFNDPLFLARHASDADFVDVRSGSAATGVHLLISESEF